jgi:acylglycerol lipase
MSNSASDTSAYRSETQTVTWFDGVDFFTKRWMPNSSSTPRALVVFLHGFAEHVERYNEVWSLFAAHDIEVFGYPMTNVDSQEADRVTATPH